MKHSDYEFALFNQDSDAWAEEFVLVDVEQEMEEKLDLRVDDVVLAEQFAHSEDLMRSIEFRLASIKLLLDKAVQANAYVPN